MLTLIGTIVISLTAVFGYGQNNQSILPVPTVKLWQGTYKLVSPLQSCLVDHVDISVSIDKSEKFCAQTGGIISNVNITPFKYLVQELSSVNCGTNSWSRSELFPRLKDFQTVSLTVQPNSSETLNLSWGSDSKLSKDHTRIAVDENGLLTVDFFRDGKLETCEFRKTTN